MKKTKQPTVQQEALRLIALARETDRVILAPYSEQLHHELRRDASDEQEIEYTEHGSFGARAAVGDARELWLNGLAGTRWTVRLVREVAP